MVSGAGVSGYSRQRRARTAAGGMQMDIDIILDPALTPQQITEIAVEAE